MPDILIELFSEEIPARMQARAADDLKRLVTNGMVEAGLTYGHAAAFHTPRRLTLALEGVLAASPAVREERKGPRVDAPEKALEGFLRSTGLAREALEVRDDKKSQVYFAVIERAGRPAEEIVAEALTETIRNFPWPKSMRWGAGSLRWVRPLHGILCLLTDETEARVVPLEIDGISSRDWTNGHRFMAPEAIHVTSFEDYEAKLKRAHVILRAEERAETIWHDATQMAFASGLEVVEDKGLLAEVAGLVEWPVVLMGEIDAAFLELPAEVLQTSMKEHQKFFSVKNPKTGRIERFITVANRETADQGEAILAGNRKVLTARLSDAKFFWENDLRVARADGMTAMAEPLRAVTFQSKLGSVSEKILRVSVLSEHLAPITGADPKRAAEAARIAKADLASEMVNEFPELQGVMGSYYAKAAGHADEVAEAAALHYSPLGPSDDVPTQPVAVAVALADKIDTLTGFWSIDEKPTGSKDPFALRRAALGVIRLILENNLRMSLGEVFALANGEADADDLLGFFHDRLKVFLRDQGVPHDVIDAVTGMDGADDLMLLVRRAQALGATMATADGENLLQGFRRAANILAQAEAKDGVEYSFGPDRKFAEVPEEIALFDALDAADREIEPALAAEDFEAAMAAMAGLRAPTDAFFEAVQVNVENEIQRRNRLNLLHRIRATCLQVADLSRLAG